MSRWIFIWIVVSFLTAIGQLALHTDPLFVALSLTIFLLTPVVFNAYLRLGNIGAFIFAATYGKLFLLSQWIKIALRQPADSHLLTPVPTALVLLLALLAFWLAALALHPVLHRFRGLLTPSEDPDFLLWLARFALGLTLVSILLRHFLGLNRVGEAEYEEGRGLVVVLFLGQLLPLAAAALTARAAILSDGRRFVDWRVVTALLLTAAQGLWENQRMIMMAGLVAFAAAYLSYGGRVRLRHLAAAAGLGLAMQWLIFPLVDAQRNIARDLSPVAFIAETFRLAGNFADSETRGDYADSLDEMYRSWVTRLYYGDPLGFLDRFAPNAVDETVEYIDSVGPFGLQTLTDQLLWGIPNAILRPLGLERPIRNGELLETSILGEFTNMNYGLIAEAYACVGLKAFLPTITALFALYFFSLHIFYGSTHRNYFAAFSFSATYFTLASSDLAELTSQITIQAPLYLMVVVAAGLSHRFLRS